MNAITPAGARLTVTEPVVPEDEGLWLPPEAQGVDVEMAVVVERGEGCSLPVEAGDRVYFHHGHFAKIGEVKVVAEDCILAYEKR